MEIPVSVLSGTDILNIERHNILATNKAVISSFFIVNLRFCIVPLRSLFL